MSYVQEAKNLKKNIRIMANTFANFNLEVVDIGCKPYDDEDGNLFVYVEIVSVKAVQLKNDLLVKINLYDQEGELYANYEYWLQAEKFHGYDTIQIECYDDGHTLENARSGKLFVTQA